MEEWGAFCTAQLGASAARAGLVFVGASINLVKITAALRLVNVTQEAILARA